VTENEIEAALASRSSGDMVKARAGGQPRAPIRALGADSASLVPPSPAEAAPIEVPRRSVAKAPRCVPPAYAVGAVALKARMDARLWKALSRMRSDERCGAVFLGPSGCGKSSAAAYALLRWSSSVGAATTHRGRVFWLDALEATDAERRYKLGSGDPELLVDAYRAEWLVIDDIGLSTSAMVVQLVMARRYAAGLATIATTGLTRAQLSEHVGAATVRRILEFRGQKGLLVDCHGRA
jgi:hypothetical protein